MNHRDKLPESNGISRFMARKNILQWKGLEVLHSIPDWLIIVFREKLCTFSTPNLLFVK